MKIYPDDAANQMSKRFPRYTRPLAFLFHKVLLKVGDVAVSKCNCNFAKFHQYLMAMAQHISWRECSKTTSKTNYIRKLIL